MKINTPARRLASRLLLVPMALLAVPAIGNVQEGVVYRVPVSGVIELGLAPFVRRSIQEANENGARAVILDIDTPGGRVDAAQQMVKGILESEIPIYALVNPHAFSAGALVALATDSIYVVPGSSIGAATPVSGAGEKAPEKIVSAMRSEFRALAERRGLDPRIAEAMVDEDIEVEGVVEAGKLLTLTGQEAVSLTVATKEVSGFNELLDELGVSGSEVVVTSANWAEQVVRFLSHPLVSPLLLSLGTLGLLIEIRTPSFGVAGLTGLIALSAFFGSHLIVGLAGMEEFILLGVGLVALLIEAFVIPGFGIAGIISILCISAATFMALIGSLPTWGDVARASGILVVAAALVAVGLYTMVRSLPSSNKLRGIFLRATTNKAAGYIAEPAREDLIGAEGVSLTDLRPSGTARIFEERLDVVSDTGYIPKGARVRVIRSEGYRLVVESVQDASDA